MRDDRPALAVGNTEQAENAVAKKAIENAVTIEGSEASPRLGSSMRWCPPKATIAPMSEGVNEVRSVNK